MWFEHRWFRYHCTFGFHCCRAAPVPFCSNTQGKAALKIRHAGLGISLVLRKVVPSSAVFRGGWRSFFKRKDRRRRQLYLVNTMVGVTARLVSVAVKDHDLDDHVTEGEYGSSRNATSSLEAARASSRKVESETSVCPRVGIRVTRL